MRSSHHTEPAPIDPTDRRGPTSASFRAAVRQLRVRPPPQAPMRRREQSLGVALLATAGGRVGVRSSAEEWLNCELSVTGNLGRRSIHRLCPVLNATYARTAGYVLVESNFAPHAAEADVTG